MHKIVLALLMSTFTLIQGTNAATVTPLLTEALPPILANQEVVMLTVAYEPGEASTPHRHNAHTFVYVLEGEIGMQVEGGDEVALSAGGIFHELPADVHTVSRNRSNTQPAKFLVFLVKEVGAPTTVPLP